MGDDILQTINEVISNEEAAANKKIPFGDMFETDPIRHKDLLPCTAKPFCGEPKIDLLTKDYYTPNELFYVRFAPEGEKQKAA